MSVVAASAVVAAVAAIAGTAMSASAAASQAKAQQNAANYQAQVAENNATIANQNANYAIAAGQAKAQQTSMANAQRMGAIMASEAANGVDVNTGSNKDVQVSQRETGQLAAETDINNALLQAYGYKAQAAGFQGSSDMSKMQADQGTMAAIGGVGGSLLSGAKSLPTSWGSGSSGATNSLTGNQSGQVIGGGIASGTITPDF